MKPKTPCSLAQLLAELETLADTQEEFAGTSLQSAHTMSETHATLQTIAVGDFRFVQLDSDASETYLQ